MKYQLPLIALRLLNYARVNFKGEYIHSREFLFMLQSVRN